MDSSSSYTKKIESSSSSDSSYTSDETCRQEESICTSRTKECLVMESENKVDSQIVRSTEITCMYSSCDEVCKTTKPQEYIQETEKCTQIQQINDWNVVKTSIGADREILLEIDARDPGSSDLKDVQAVELVIAVQSAIKQRQDLIEEWKIKTLSLTDQIEKLQQDKFCLEKSNLCKESELELLARKLNDLHKQYKNLLHDSSQLKRELELLRIEYKKLTEAYNLTVCELKETKRRLSEAVETEKTLESRLRQQISKNEFFDQSSQKIEIELEDSRKQIKRLTNSLDETTKELNTIKQHMDENRMVETKLESLKSKYKLLKSKFENVNSCLQKSYDENTSLKQKISSLNLAIENLSSDKKELMATIEILTREKNSLLEQNHSLSKELKVFKHNFSQVQIELRSLQSEVDSLRSKIEDLESCNVNLLKELNCTRGENKKLNENLKITVSECTTLSRALSEAQCQLDMQQKALLKVETKVKILIQEKQNLEQIIKCLKDDQKRGINEANTLAHENSHVKGQNNDLICKLNKVTIDLNDSLNEIKHLECEVANLRQCIENEKAKHESHIIHLQEKIRNKSREWKEYVTKEVQRLRNKRRHDIRQYLEMNKDLERRLQISQDDAKKMEMDLNTNIMELTKQLEISRTKLEETICQANSNKAELIQKSHQEINQLKELLSKQKLESQWMITEMESKIQQLVEKNLDDEAVIHTLTRENGQLKDKLEKITEECRTLAISQADYLKFQQTKHLLECELANCQGLLKLAEETKECLKAENTELLERIKTEEEKSQNLHTRICKLKKIIGKKDAHIEMLDNTICQLKQRITAVTDENTDLKSTLIDLETQHNDMSQKINNLNQELVEAKRALIQAGDDQVDLIKTVKEIEKNIKKLECENSSLHNELTVARENERYAEKALENSHLIQAELREKISKAECVASKSANEARQLECKLHKMQETVTKLECEISTLTEAYQYNDSQHRKKIESLECQLSSANQEICSLKHQLEKSESKIYKLKERLRESQAAFCSLASVFDNLRETLSQILCIDYVPIVPDLSSDSQCNQRPISSRNTHDYVNSYKCEVEKYCQYLIDLKKSETELDSKLTTTKKDFEKLGRIMKDLQSEYMQKVEKLYQSLKQKDEIIRTQEKQLVSIQLEAANADDVLSQNLKCKIEDQQNYVKKLQEEKSVLQSEILCLAKKVNHLESQIFELVEKLKCIENKNSKLQVKNVSLEGDLEKLTLLLKDARDVEQDQICQYKQMMLANRELMEKIRVLKCELEKGKCEINDLQSKKQCQENLCCLPNKTNFCEREIENEIKVLTEKLTHSIKAENEAKHALCEMERNLSKIKSDLAESQSEKASLEGWVTHLQQMMSGGYVTDSTLPSQLCKIESEKKYLIKTVENLKCNVATLLEEKGNFKKTIEHLAKCNQNLKESMACMAKNKLILEKELLSIQKKVENICQSNKTSEIDLSTCTKDISFMIENACNITKSLKCQDSQYETNTQTKCSDGNGYTCPFKLTTEESLDSVSVGQGCQTKCNDSSSGCFIKKFETTEKMTQKQQPKHKISKQKDQTASTTFTEIHLKHKIHKKPSRESLHSDKNGKTYL